MRTKALNVSMWVCWLVIVARCLVGVYQSTLLIVGGNPWGFLDIAIIAGYTWVSSPPVIDRFMQRLIRRH
jgi:hypothetical protein